MTLQGNSCICVVAGGMWAKQMQRIKLLHNIQKHDIKKKYVFTVLQGFCKLIHFRPCFFVTFYLPKIDSRWIAYKSTIYEMLDFPVFLTYFPQFHVLGCFNTTHKLFLLSTGNWHEYKHGYNHESWNICCVKRFLEVRILTNELYIQTKIHFHHSFWLPFGVFCKLLSLLFVFYGRNLTQCRLSGERPEQ